MEPIAAKTDPKHVSRQHQAIQHFISNSAWEDDAVLSEVRAYALPAITKHAPINAWIIDDTGMPKKEYTPSASRINTAGNLVSKQTAKSP
jgi:SRSO17 transposase